MVHCRITEDHLSIEQKQKGTVMSEQLRRIGYLRIFDRDQNHDVRADALQPGCAEIYEATEPFATPTARKQLLDLLNNGDELIVYRLDRLSRDEHTLVNLQQQLQAMGVTLVVVDDQETKGDDHAE
jgi:DNA invertase Pin-like site-specific DNA recombinase